MADRHGRRRQSVQRGDAGQALVRGSGSAADRIELAARAAAMSAEAVVGIGGHSTTSTSWNS